MLAAFAGSSSTRSRSVAAPRTLRLFWRAFVGVLEGKNSALLAFFSGLEGLRRSRDIFGLFTMPLLQKFDLLFYLIEDDVLLTDDALGLLELLLKQGVPVLFLRSPGVVSLVRLLLDWLSELRVLSHLHF